MGNGIWHCLTSWFGRPRRIEHKLDLILIGQGDTVATLEDLVKAIDDETNIVAKRIDNLQSDLAAAVANNQAPKPETLAELQSISDRLKNLGGSVTTPIPPPVGQPNAQPPITIDPATPIPDTTTLPSTPTAPATTDPGSSSTDPSTTDPNAPPSNPAT